MTASYVCWVVLCPALCACGVDETTSTAEQPGINLQGINLQGINLQGINLQGMNMVGYHFDGATLSGATLDHVRVERGELVAQSGPLTLRGAALVGAHLYAEGRNITVTPPATATVEYRITAIAPELPQYDPTHTGNSYLYTLEQRVSETGAWQQACAADPDGRSFAIPVAAIWNEHGDRVESSTLFTFGCTSGVIAKCYRWGYRPWVTGYGDLTAMHQTCTRAARADYCGIGVSHTRNGTSINIWDAMPAPGPIQSRAGIVPAAGMLFEAGWDTGGAVCLSHSRWLLDDGLALAAMCPTRLVPLGILPAICDTIPDVLGLNTNAKMYTEAYLNLGLLGIGLGL